MDKEDMRLALRITFGIVAAGAALFGLSEYDKNVVHSCAIQGISNGQNSARVTEWRLTGGYTLSYLRPNGRVIDRQDHDDLDVLQRKANEACRTGVMTLSHN